MSGRGWRALIPQSAKNRLHRVLRPWRIQHEIDALYSLLYARVHDLDQSLDLSARQTREAFAKQWEELPEGDGLLSDDWFRSNVTRILAEEELQLKPEWFAGKRVLDAGCGNGRWSFGLASLGANVTAVDVNPGAVEATRKALAGFDAQFHVTPLEELSQVLGDETFDLVFSWGVIHHTGSLTRSLDQLCQRVSPGGVLYLYVYGRESISLAADLELFKQRVQYNVLEDDAARRDFLLARAQGNLDQLNAMHDLYAPLVNRRLRFEELETPLLAAGFEEVTRTLDHTELFVRAFRSQAADYHARWTLPAPPAPYWFERYAG